MVNREPEFQQDCLIQILVHNAMDLNKSSHTYNDPYFIRKLEGSKFATFLRQHMTLVQQI